MKPHDWKYSGIAASALLGIAAFIIFAIHPGGFEGQIGWFFFLLPGAYVGAVIAGQAPLLAAVSAWPIIFIFSILWYFAISYAVIKTYRFVSSRFFGANPD
jgi:hypothetical protein